MYVPSWELYTDVAFLSNTVLAGPTRDTLQGEEIELEEYVYEYQYEKGDEELEIP